QLIPERFSEEELERLAVADETRSASFKADGEGPWLEDGPSWHLNHNCSEKTRPIAEELIRVIGSAVPPGVEPDWGQKYYIAWRRALTPGHRTRVAVICPAGSRIGGTRYR